MAVKLTRAALDVKTLRAVTDEKFVREARTLLGYRVPETARILRQTAEVLQRLGIDPIKEEDVAVYKREQAETLRSRKREPSRLGGMVEVRTRGVWETKSLHGYMGEIPQFAIERAAQIKRALNRVKVGSTFQVDELVLHSTRRRVQPKVIDPFMVLVVGNNRIFIDVWNEPKFEGRRTR